ncbi:radical SAM protein [Paenibacillus alba]|uniref:Heme chaperone HemW n=1 Tax=Paenibacillus alba TaxID=1197127 RepID=A0ABU6GCR2_9BACL|nr:radical SAM protein [Paenibacillus alba]MEC0231042.1 radical SAM protein [Paenibacillus alba]
MQAISPTDRKEFISNSIKFQIKNDLWPGYVHGYPHKKAYRTMKHIGIQDIWKPGLTELNLYIHIPFCERICSFCNLFKMAVGKNDSDLLDNYVEAVIRQIDYYKKYIGNPTIKSLFYGGGTPNVLSIKQLEKIQNKLHKEFTDWSSDVESCIECSPDKLNNDYVKALKEIGFDRVSIGVQTFLQEESNLINRKYESSKVYEVYNLLKEHGLNVNMDLIYGLPSQTEETIQKNLEEVVKCSPETITIYPLAIRKLTGMEKYGDSELMSMKEKYFLYEPIRTYLEDSGYMCQTIVRYVKTKTSTYQQQRMEFQGVPTLGIGAGSRSYAPDVHYCLPYKVQGKYVNEIVQNYITCDFKDVVYDGFLFNEEEKKRKFVLLSLLDPGLDTSQYQLTFNESIEVIFNDELQALKENELIESKDGVFFTLTRKGRKYSDIAVHIFESENLKNLYDTFIHE